MSNKSRDSRFISPRSLCDLAPEQVVVLSPIILGTPIPMEHPATAEQCILVPVTGFPGDFQMSKILLKLVREKGSVARKGAKKKQKDGSPSCLWHLVKSFTPVQNVYRRTLS